VATCALDQESGLARAAIIDDVGTGWIRACREVLVVVDKVFGPEIQIPPKVLTGAQHLVRLVCQLDGTAGPHASQIEDANSA